MKKYIALILLLFSASCFAGYQIGQVTKIIVRDSDGLTYFFVSGTGQEKPACAALGYWVIKDENSVAAKAQLSMILAAYSSGKTIRVDGYNTCSRWRDGEDVNAIQLR